MILVAAVIEPLRAANRITGKRLYDWRLATLEGQAIETTAGISIPVDKAFDAAPSERPLFVVSSYNWQQHETQSTKRLLVRAARSRPMVAGVESGTWLLAAAGLLDGYKASIHWEDRELFASRFPGIEMVADRYVFDKNRMTTGGALPTLDMMLEIIRRRQGHATALEVARSFLYERDPSVREMLPPTTTTIGVADSRLARAIKIMEDSLAHPVPVEEIASRVNISSRHLQTLFQQAFNVSPHVHYLALRLNAARRLVIESRIDLAVISENVGFSAPSVFSRAYRNQFGESPTATRKRAVPR
ncbi:GlxA family transcriptional regulator [Mesorhizobium sp.]|uniref:GlxA family transcriptional regulator n=1 Tax=Mesorhizobium sp. TaxID=1871066 RepID=UPI00257AA297|nr:GlxA family transcriptional regulator [Mesorhizobium sp.]